MTYETKPTATIINSFVESFKENNPFDNENYLAAIKLTKTFFKNDNYQNIFIKVNFINGAFKTTISDTFGVAKQIFKNVRNIDTRINVGDKTLINEIAYYKSSKSKTVRKNYSFATKFCHCHKPSLFPIYDKYVSNSLFEFNKHFEFSEFTKKDLLDYDKFFNVIRDFRRNIIADDRISFATIDRFLWALGRKTESKKNKEK